MKGENVEGLSDRIGRLVELLGKPMKGELGYREEEKLMPRLDALKELKRFEKSGVISPPEKSGGTNTHIHTNESFSIFRSPTEAAWKGYRAGLDVLGINDHYTISGHREFREACGILGLKATFSIEAVAMSEKAKKSGLRYNDPVNPGRIYLCGKGVVHDLKPGCNSERDLATMKNSLRQRDKKMTKRVEFVLKKINSSLRLSFEDVLKLTPHGNTTERHIAQAIAELINRSFPKKEKRKEFLEKLLREFEEEDISTEWSFQNLLRNRLLKAGCPAYVEELPEAFLSPDRMVSLFKDFGAIPTYPVLGNPITEKESDLDSLFMELENLGILAVEVIPNRNTRRRLQEILDSADRRGFPVFNGTEHNTKCPQPLLDKLSGDPNFLPTFRRGAQVILGHQFLSTYAGTGYIDSKGRPSIEEKRDRLSFFCFVGRIMWPDTTLKQLITLGKGNTRKLIFGLYNVLDDDGYCEWVAKPDIWIPNNLVKTIKIKNGLAFFLNEGSKNRFREFARGFLSSKAKKI